MMSLRPAAERGRTYIDWLDSRHTFSFGAYQDPRYRGFSSLLVINDDRVAPGGGFALHGHNNMEIITYVLSGALEHKDSLGNGSVIYPGDVQRMSAGTGIRHSEFNHSKTEPVHFLQIWIVPETQDLQPSYEQRSFADSTLRKKLQCVAKPDAGEDAVTIHQQASIHLGTLRRSESVQYDLRSGRKAWMHVARGACVVSSLELEDGDGMAIWDERRLAIQAVDDSEFLIFDLP